MILRPGRRRGRRRAVARGMFACGWCAALALALTFVPARELLGAETPTPPWGAREPKDTPPHPPGVPPPSSLPAKRKPAAAEAPVKAPEDLAPPAKAPADQAPPAKLPASEPTTPQPAPPPAKRAPAATRTRVPASSAKPTRSARRAAAARAAPAAPALSSVAGERIPPPSDALRAQSAELPENAPVARTADGDWLAAPDLARLLSATKYWHAEVRKLELRTPQHRIQLTADNPFVLLDDRTLQLPLAVRASGGQLYVPVALIDSLPHDSTLTRLIHDARRGLVLRVPPEGLVRTPRIEPTATLVRLTFPTDRPEEAVVVGRGRAHFRVRFGGLFVGLLPDSLPATGLLRGVHIIPASEGSAFELQVAPEVQGYRVTPAARGDAVDLVLSREAGAGFERFAPEGPEGARRLKVIVLDPGHGGSDAGVTAAGAIEKDLALALARDLARELEAHLGARVVLTRTDDRGPSMQERAETANRAHADVVLSLHFDGAPSASARGVTAYCPPATFGGAAVPDEGPRPVVMLPWRDVATRHAVRSRELAEAVLSALELRGLGPTRLREQLPYPLLGVNAPGLLIECATLTSDADRARVTGAQGLADLARAIAAGLDAYRRAE